MSLQGVGSSFSQFPDAYDYLRQQEEPPEIIRYIVMRHGQTPSNLEQKVGGQTIDVDLTEAGQDQARSLGQKLAAMNLTIAGAFSSSLIRAQETLRLCMEMMQLKDTAVFISDKIIEKHFGRDEGLSADLYVKTTQKEALETDQLTWEQKFTYRAHPEDLHLESLSQVYQRARIFFEQDLPAGNYLVSTHKVVKKTQVMGLLKEKGIEVGYRSFELSNCSVLIIEVGKDKSLHLVAASGIEVAPVNRY